MSVQDSLNELLVIDELWRRGWVRKLGCLLGILFLVVAVTIGQTMASKD